MGMGKYPVSGSSFTVYWHISAREKGTNRDHGTYIMKDMVDRVEAICGEVKQDDIFGTGTRTAEENMSNMLHLSFANYLASSKEYTVIIENTIQYMGGLMRMVSVIWGHTGTEL